MWNKITSLSPYVYFDALWFTVPNAIETARPQRFDVTASCAINHAINAYVLVKMILFTEESNFSDIFRQDKCYSAR